jgi:hypothetical protein
MGEIWKWLPYLLNIRILKNLTTYFPRLHLLVFFFIHNFLPWKQWYFEKHFCTILQFTNIKWKSLEPLRKSWIFIILWEIHPLLDITKLKRKKEKKTHSWEVHQCCQLHQYLNFLGEIRCFHRRDKFHENIHLKKNPCHIIWLNCAIYFIHLLPLWSISFSIFNFIHVIKVHPCSSPIWPITFVWSIWCMNNNNIANILLLMPLFFIKIAR